MSDPTESMRRQEVIRINSQVASDDSDSERKRLEKVWDQVWNTTELQEDFIVNSFMAPFCSVTRKSDNQKGLIEFQHIPRFYFNFIKV